MAINRSFAKVAVACVISLAMSGGVLAGNSLRSFEADPNVTVIDDFESYTNGSPNLLCETWLDGINRTDRPGNHSGAMTGTLFSGMIAHGGGQSMPLYYNNFNLPYYSEVVRPFATPQDWLGGDANSLYLCSLWFRGRASNASDSICLSLEDSTGHKGSTTDPNSQTISREEWQQWAVRLTAFTAAGVDLHKVHSIGIGIGSRTNPHATGSGVIYVDDIEVHRAAPMPLPPDLVEVAGSSIRLLGRTCRRQCGGPGEPGSGREAAWIAAGGQNGQHRDRVASDPGGEVHDGQPDDGSREVQ